jgi:hypothetical protein
VADRPLQATPDTTIRRVTEDQMKTLRQARDNLEEVQRCLRGNLEDIADVLTEMGRQVVTERTE